jgi:hypothetical protein
MTSKMIKRCALAIALCVLLPLVVYGYTNSAGYNPAVDLNGDGKIDIKDIAIVARLFGTAALPSLSSIPPVDFNDAWPASQYWMTGGDDPNALYKGADNFFLSGSPFPGAPPSWPTTTYSVLLAHTHDYVVYDINTTVTAYLDAINITLRNLTDPLSGTPVSIWVWNGTWPNIVPTLSHDMDLAAPNPIQPNYFVLYGNVTIPYPGNWAAYYLTNSTVRNWLMERDQYYVGVRLDNGTLISPGVDMNAEIGWIRLSVP